MFQVGDWVICDCGMGCPPFQVLKFSHEGCWVYSEENSAYMLPEDDKLRKLTKLELALK